MEYKASTAQWHVERRARRPEVAGLVADGRPRDCVQRRLSGGVCDGGGTVIGPTGPEWKSRDKPHRGDRAWGQAWSPEQIAKRLPVDFPDDE